MKKIMVLSALLTTVTIAYADWIDDLVAIVGSTKEWRNQEAQEIVEKYLQEDQAEVDRIEKKVKGLKSGFWATFHRAAYKTELFTARSQKNYHEKLLKAFKEMPENKKDRQKLVDRLVALYEYETQLRDLKEQLSKGPKFGEQVKLAALIAAKQTQITTTRSLIKGSFVF